MKRHFPASETFEPLTDAIDFSSAITDITLLMSTPRARIYRARRAGKRILLKAPIDYSGRALDLLKREYELAVGLDHPHIADVYTWESASPVGPCIVMEYVDGRRLGEYLEERPSLKSRQRVFLQLLDAAAYIHRHGVTHNDLKPTNVMVSRAADDLKVIDFGLADDDAHDLTRNLGGTHGYTSPELRDCQSDTDTRSDIYSLGVIMGDMFGKRYGRIARRCMAERRERRFRDVDTLRRAFRRRINRTNHVLWATITAILICIIGAGALMMQNMERTATEAQGRMLDTIAALKANQAVSADSIAALNASLGAIEAEAARADSVERAFKADIERLTQRYVAKLRQTDDLSEAFVMLRRFEEDFTAVCRDYSTRMPEYSNIPDRNGGALLHDALGVLNANLPTGYARAAE